MKQVLSLLGICLFCLSSCVEADPVPSSIEGQKPIYKTIVGSDIASLEPRPFGDLGKIVFVDPYIFINEIYEGIHVVDNTNPADPQRVAFWYIPGNTDFTIDGQWLYADNSKDLYTINITDINNIELVHTNSNIYNSVSTTQLFPPNFTGSFECVDTTKGVVVGWETDILIGPKCWR